MFAGTLALLRRTTLALVMASAAFAPAFAGPLKDGQVLPGDSNYPKPDPNPRRFVQLTATVPSTLKIEFTTFYIATSSSCSWSRGWGAGRGPQYALVPLATHGDGPMRMANVAIEGVLPGRCKWKLNGLGYRILDGSAADNLPPPEDSNSTGGFASRWGASYAAAYTGPAEVWCREQSNYKPNQADTPQCSDWDLEAHFEHVTGMGNPDLRVDPVNFGSTDVRNASIFDDTKSIEVHFRDIDVEGAAFREKRP